jgi:hypothetical protein
MYDTKFECRYHKDNVFLEGDYVTDEEKNIIRNVLYKEDVLNIFFIDDFDDDFDIFSNVMNELYKKIKDFLPFKECMKKMAAKLMSEDEQTGLILMYSYDYMYITHKCVSEYLEITTISEENMKLLSEFSNNIL